MVHLHDTNLLQDPLRQMQVTMLWMHDPITSGLDSAATVRQKFGTAFHASRRQFVPSTLAPPCNIPH